MSHTEIILLVEDAVARLLHEQQKLLTLNVGEPTLAQHIAGYIREGIPKDLAVDVEYNKHGMERKVLLLPPKNQPNADPVQTVVRPDIVVHERGNDERNILAIEVKKPGTDLSHDRRKLEALMQQYGYELAAHIIVGIKGAELVGETKWING